VVAEASASIALRAVIERATDDARAELLDALMDLLAEVHVNDAHPSSPRPSA
jgi:hypothetical protein